MPSLSYLAYAKASNPRPLATAPNGTVMYNGDFGSAIAQAPSDPAVFYLLTDQGPHAAVVAADSIIFGKADFTPQLGKLRLIAQAEQLTFKNI